MHDMRQTRLSLHVGITALHVCCAAQYSTLMQMLLIANGEETHKPMTRFLPYPLLEHLRVEQLPVPEGHR